MRISKINRNGKNKNSRNNRLDALTGKGFTMNANIIQLQSSISRNFSRRFFLTSKYFHLIALLNKTLRIVVYDGLKQSNKKTAVKPNNAKSSFIKFNGGGVWLKKLK